LILFCGFGLLSRINTTTIVALGFGAFSVGSALCFRHSPKFWPLPDLTD
jgi:hypothetical protein